MIVGLQRTLTFFKISIIITFDQVRIKSDKNILGFLSEAVCEGKETYQRIKYNFHGNDKGKIMGEKVKKLYLKIRGFMVNSLWKGMVNCYIMFLKSCMVINTT